MKYTLYELLCFFATGHSFVRIMSGNDVRVCLLLQLMQNEVEQLQEVVNGLHSMVVVVDESNADSGNTSFCLFQPIIAGVLTKYIKYSVRFNRESL